MLLLLLPNLSKADEFNIIDTLKKLPITKHGVAYNVKDYEVNYLTTVGIARYGALDLDAGFSSDSKAVATLSYELGGLKRFGIDTPITNFINLRVGAYVGYGRLTGSNEFSWGPAITLAEVKF